MKRPRISDFSIERTGVVSLARHKPVFFILNNIIPMIVKTKFLCKSTCKIGSRSGIPRKGPTSHSEVDYVAAQIPDVWTETFISGKWYDGEYETWSFEDGYRLNDGWRRYWVINEQGRKEEISKSYMNVMFYKPTELRDKRIDDILGTD